MQCSTNTTKQESNKAHTLHWLRNAQAHTNSNYYCIIRGIDNISCYWFYRLLAIGWALFSFFGNRHLHSTKLRFHRKLILIYSFSADSKANRGDKSTKTNPTKTNLFCRQRTISDISTFAGTKWWHHQFCRKKIELFALKPVSTRSFFWRWMW